MAKNNKKAAKPDAKVAKKKKGPPYVLYVLRGGPRNVHSYVGVRVSRLLEPSHNLRNPDPDTFLVHRANVKLH